YGLVWYPCAAETRPRRYRTIGTSVFYRLAAIAALSTVAIFAQQAASIVDLQPDMTDSGVIRAQDDVRRVQLLINEGALPMIRLKQANEELQNALDMSMLRRRVYSKDLPPEQADQMGVIAQ